MEKPSELTVTCPQPRTLATGEFECPLCGAIWDKDEETPECRSRRAHGDFLRQQFQLNGEKST